MPILQIDEEILIGALTIAVAGHTGIPADTIRDVIARAQGGTWGMYLDEPACICPPAMQIGPHHVKRCNRYRNDYAQLRDDGTPYPVV